MDSPETKATLYVSHTCLTCLAVLDYLHASTREDVHIVYVHPAMDSATLKREYILLATGARTNTLPGIPALVHGEKLVVGNEVVAYLELNPQLL